MSGVLCLAQLLFLLGAGHLRGDVAGEEFSCYGGKFHEEAGNDDGLLLEHLLEGVTGAELGGDSRQGELYVGHVVEFRLYGARAENAGGYVRP